MTLAAAEVARTADWIAAAQVEDGAIPWWPGGRLDPWNHVEAAMGLDVAGRHEAARRAYGWLAATQRADGAWPATVRGTELVDPTLDANFCAYVAAGTRHHLMATGDERFAGRMWPVVEAAIDFALGLQSADGSVYWARDATGRAWPAALLTSSSCVHLSLSKAIELAAITNNERPDWELALSELGDAVRSERGAFERKDRYSMDWYYPVLGGAVRDERAWDRLYERWDEFVVPERGARCVADRPWVTAAETCELVLSLVRVGRVADAGLLFEWIQYLRSSDGAYWTGATFPDGTVWPAEKTTWSAGAALLAVDALQDDGPAARFFRDPAADRDASVALDAL